MKNLILLLAALIFLHDVTFSQDCFPNGIVFSTQEQIDNFPVNYPYCTVIAGDVRIFGDSITNINALSILTYIGGYLEINSNPNLASLTGFDNITGIGGAVRITYNPNLTNLEGLSNIDSIGEGIFLANNIGLTSLTGLEGLHTIGGELSIFENDALSSLTGLENLTSMGNFLAIRGNAVLTGLNGLENIEMSSIGYLMIDSNPNLSNCAVENICSFLASPVGEIDIFDNASGCDDPSEVAGACGISQFCLPYGNYHFLTQVDVDSFQFRYPGCTQLGGSVEISGNTIENLNGLNNVTSVGVDLKIRNNQILESLLGLENLTSIGRGLTIQSNDSLFNLSGLEGLHTIGNNFIIQDNNKLANLTGLGNLTSVGKNLSISSNPSLTSITGLAHLVSISGDLGVMSNSSLTSLSGLDHINANSIWRLKITNNNSLSTCDVESICDFLTISWESEIYQNATGCDSPQQVEDACEMGIGESAVDGRRSAVNIIPNPASTNITIELPVPSSQFQISIFNLSGQEIISGQVPEAETFIDISSLPPGVYFARVTTDRTVLVGKFVKM